MSSTKDKEDKFLYYLFRLVTLWLVAVFIIVADNKQEIETYVSNYLTERFNHEQTIEHDAGRGQDHNI